MSSLPISKAKETEPHFNHCFQGYMAIEEPGQCWNMLEHEVLLPFSVWNPQKQILRYRYESKQLIAEAIPGGGEMERKGKEAGKCPPGQLRLLLLGDSVKHATEGSFSSKLCLLLAEHASKGLTPWPVRPPPGPD